MSKFQLKDSTGKLYMGWKIVLMGIILNVFGYSCIVAAVGIFVVPVTSDLGIQIGDYVIWLTINSIVAMIYLVFSQKIYSEATVKKLMIISSIMGVIGFAGFGTANGLMQFYIFAIFLGICFAGTTMTPCSLLVTNWFGTKLRGKALGIMFGGTGLAYMVVLPALSFVMQSFGWRVCYFTLAGIHLLICLPFIIKYAAWSPAKMGIERMGDAENEGVEEETVARAGISFKDGLKKPSTWLFFLSGTLLVIGSSSILTHTPTLLYMADYSESFGANVMSILSGFCVITTVFVGSLVDRLSIRVSASLCGITFALAYICLLNVHNAGIIMVILFMVCYALGVPSVNLVTPSISNYMFGEKEAGAFIGYANMFISLGGAFGSTVVGKLLDATGSYLIPLSVCFGLTVLMIIIRFVVTSPKFNYKNNIE